MTRTRHLVYQSLAAFAILLVILGVTGVLVVSSGWFREQVRERIVNEIENATGGRAELGSFSFNWPRLQATVTSLVLHGTEPATEPPLLRVESVTLRLRIISMLERKVDLAFLRVQQPLLHIMFYPDGTTNLPSPHRPAGEKSWAQNLVDLAVRRYEITNGLAEIDLRQVPLDFRGEDLRLRMDYDVKNPRYQGDLATRHLRIASENMTPVEADVNGKFVLSGTQIEFPSLQIGVGQSRVDLVGSLTDLRAPHGAFKAKASVALRDAVPIFALPLAPSGSLTFDGDVSVSFTGGFDYTIAGRTVARGLDYRKDRLVIENATASGALRATPGQLTLRGFRGTALGATIAGQIDLIHNRNFHFAGTFDGLGVHQAAAVFTDRPLPWDATMAGTLTTDTVFGERDAKVHATAVITPVPEGRPIQGQVDLNYDQQAGTLDFGNSQLQTPATALTFSGTLGQRLEVRARTTNLDDVLPALALVSANPPRSLPLKLNRGEVAMVGTVTGPLDDPEFRGEGSVTNASIQGYGFDRLNSDVQASRRSVALSRLTLVRGAAQITGDASIQASGGGFSAGSLAARLQVKNAPVAETARDLGITTPLSGVASANIRLSGTPRNIEAEGALDVANAAALGEHFDRLRATLHYTARSLAFTGGQADLGMGKVLFAGSFEHPEATYKNGTLRLDLNAQNLMASRIAALRQQEPKFEARLDGKTSLQVQLQNGTFEPQSVNGEVSARNVTFDRSKLGDLTLNAQSTGKEMALTAKATLLGAAVDAQGKWSLEGNLPGSAIIHFPHVNLVTLHDLVAVGSATPISTPPFDGFAAGSATFNVPLRQPRELQGEVQIDTLELNAKANQALRLGVQPQDIQIHNTQPILIAVSAKEARIRSAHFTARDTNLEASGTIPFAGNSGADLSVKGTVNLVVLQLLNPDLLARGNASVNASIRGSLRDPQLNGRMEFANASLYMNNVPNGVDNASGVILFDRNRASIERLTADTGGGQVALRGFLEFGDTLVYRLQADARQVRVRYPEDVSFTANAQLALNGTSEASLLSGSVTLDRAAISPGADLARLLAQAAKPSPAPPNPSEYLRGMRFDVHIENAPTFGLETSLTRNVQAEVDLRLRGTPLRPALLGTISVNSGIIQVFGNRYTVNRGDIRFLNPVKIEPTFDLDLETRTRGILVNVTVSGSTERLSVNYSSDPPLQPREIIALLAVGREPTSNVAGGQLSTTGGTAFGDVGGILGEAVAQQLSSRLTRFFGASRVKIDPTIDTIDNLPAARLTLEQQVSRDITLTYITNLNRTQEQIVRLQWDLNQQWSAVAVRNSNGLFDVDIQYRKRFN
jgi:translocation and assembly module TamB